jgi:hypothetical protein
LGTLADANVEPAFLMNVVILLIWLIIAPVW